MFCVCADGGVGQSSRMNDDLEAKPTRLAYVVVAHLLSSIGQPRVSCGGVEVGGGETILFDLIRVVYVLVFFFDLRGLPSCGDSRTAAVMCVMLGSINQ